MIGQPINDDLDIGLAVFEGHKVPVHVFSGSSVLAPGTPLESTAIIDQILSPLSPTEVGTIRCIGLNYKQHAEEVQLDLPTLPIIFMKPSTSLASPWPQPSLIPKITQRDDCGDWESELAVVIGKPAKNVSEQDAMDYVLGYTAANDLSSRTSQLNQSQWCFSKSFDGACPIGPTLVFPSMIPDPKIFRIRGLRNGEVVQECGLDDLIFDVPKLISFMSQSTTLLPGTVILTGTPAGVGFSRKPPMSLRAGDEFRVEILPGVGSLVNKFQNE